MPKSSHPGLPSLCTALLAVASAAPAHAQDIDACGPGQVGCHREELSFHHRAAAFDAVSIDTGWVPDGAPVQIRLGLFLGGETQVDMEAQGDVFWPAPLTVRAPGIAGTGRLAMDYGLEVVAQIRFDVEVAGIRYRWEGELPTGSWPTDLRLAGVQAFDPFLLPRSTPRPTEVSDTTDAVPVLGWDLGGRTGIAGLSGSLSVAVGGTLRTTYASERIEVGDAAPIEADGATTAAAPDPGATGFGAAKDVVITPIGRLGYEGALRVVPSLSFTIAGRTFALGLASFDVPVVRLEREVRFDPETVHVPLPDLQLRPRMLSFGAVELGRSAPMRLTLQNAGEAPLTVRPRALAEPFACAVSSITIPPRSERTVEVEFTPTMPVPEASRWLLDTNDPDAALVVVRLDGTGSFAPADDGGAGPDGGVPAGGPTTSGGCACRAASTPGIGKSAWAMVAAVALSLTRRRARRARARRTAAG